MIFVEVKRGLCDLNGPWTNREDGNMQRVLRAMGPLADEKIDTAAEELYASGRHDNERIRLSLVCMGERLNDRVRAQFPDVPQVTWDEALGFIWQRFHENSYQKADHPHWDDAGQTLWNVMTSTSSADDFSDFVLNAEPVVSHLPVL